MDDRKGLELSEVGWVLSAEAGAGPERGKARS